MRAAPSLLVASLNRCRCALIPMPLGDIDIALGIEGDHNAPEISVAPLPSSHPPGAPLRRGHRTFPFVLIFLAVSPSRR